MKILAVSDTHGKNTGLKRLIERVRPFDMFIFCGDGEGLEQEIRDLIGPGTELHMVRGNNDYFSDLPRDEEFMIGPYKAFLTHGHMYGVNTSLRRLSEEAADRGCRLAFFGHTHRPLIEETDGVVCLNPGSLSYPRQFDRRPSFLLIELDREGQLHYHQGYTED
ncbi:MAG: metallophosphoesterase [Eubacteriales bacterium]|nr:metallophosphoesterase [Eubacteriales bacterium]